MYHKKKKKEKKILGWLGQLQKITFFVIVPIQAFKLSSAPSYLLKLV